MDHFPDMDMELQSSFPKQKQISSNLENLSLLPTMGLKARELLNLSQLDKLREIRTRHLKKASQKSRFLWD